MKEKIETQENLSIRKIKRDTQEIIQMIHNTLHTQIPNPILFQLAARLSFSPHLHPSPLNLNTSQEKQAVVTIKSLGIFIYF